MQPLQLSQAFLTAAQSGRGHGALANTLKPATLQQSPRHHCLLCQPYEAAGSKMVQLYASVVHQTKVGGGTLHTDGVHDAKTRETIRHNGKCHAAATSGVSYLRYPAHMCGPSSNGRTQTKPAICCDSMSTQTCTTASALGPF